VSLRRDNREHDPITGQVDTLGGSKLLAVIDHSGEAKTRLDLLQAAVVIFGGPTAGIQ
jgi:hypothetical protein